MIKDLSGPALGFQSGPRDLILFWVWDPCTNQIKRLQIWNFFYLIIFLTGFHLYRFDSNISFPLHFFPFHIWSFLSNVNATGVTLLIEENDKQCQDCALSQFRSENPKINFLFQIFIQCLKLNTELPCYSRGLRSWLILKTRKPNLVF